MMYFLSYWTVMFRNSNNLLHELNLALHEDSLTSLNQDNDYTNDKLHAVASHSNLNSEEIISESRTLLHKRTSSLSLEEEDISGIKDSSSMVSNIMRLSTPTSILGTKHVKDVLPIIKTLKQPKSVRFNMEMNETCEIMQPELRTSTSSFDSNESEGSSDFDTEDKIKSNTLLDAISLLDSDNDESDDGFSDTVSKLTNVMSDDDESNKNLISDIDQLETEKRKLQRENKEMHQRYEKEMKQLREEYQRRREGYYDELDEVQQEVYDKRKQIKNFTEADKDMSFMEFKKRINRYLEENKEIVEKEKELHKRKEIMKEQEKEVEEYQNYLNRRHKSLTGKEEDLCTLQDELEELSDMLKAKETELKEKQNMYKPNELCKHDNAEIEKTRIELLDSLKTESQLRLRVKEKDGELQEKNTKIKSMSEELEKTKRKVKHLESQLTLIVKPVHSHFKASLTNLRHISGIPVDEKTGEYISPRTSGSTKINIRGSKSLSPVHNVPPKMNLAPIQRRSSNSTIESYFFDNSSVHTSCDNSIDSNNNDSVDQIDNELFNEEELYKADTTPTTRSSKSALSKTCVIM